MGVLKTNETKQSSKIKNIYAFIKLSTIEGKMNSLFEVKRYWSDSDDNDEECADINTQRIKGLISNENQETDILKELKSKAKSKRQTKISDVETIIEDNNEQKLYVNENIEINENQQEIKS